MTNRSLTCHTPPPPPAEFLSGRWLVGGAMLVRGWGVMRRRCGVGLCAGLVLAVVLAGALLVPPRAGAQPPGVLVSNLGQGASVALTLSTRSVAQGFTTGTYSDGYFLDSIGVSFQGSFNAAAVLAGARAELWSASGSAPGEKIADLTTPNSAASTGFTLYFSAPAGTRLDANTTYFVVVHDHRPAGGLLIQQSSSNKEEAGKAPGWSINDGYYGHISAGSTLTGDGWTDAGGSALRLVVNGRIGAGTDVGVVFAGRIDDFHKQLTINSKRGKTRLHRVNGLEAYSVGDNRFVFGQSRTEGPFRLNVTNPNNIVHIDHLVTSTPGLTDVAVYTASDNAVHRIGTWTQSDALQRFGINASGQLSSNNHVLDNDTMDEASSVAVYEIGAKDYAVVTGRGSNSVQVVDISTPTSFAKKGSLSDGDALALVRPYAVEVYTIGAKHYAVVGSAEGLQIVDVTDPDNLAASGDLTISDGIFNELHSVAVYSVGSKHYAVVGTLDNNNGSLSNDGDIRGIQFIDVTDPANPSIVSRLSPSAGVVLDRTGDLAIHRFGDRVFAVVPATAPASNAGVAVALSGLSDARVRQTDGFSIIDVTDPASPKPLVSASHHLHGGHLLGARAVTTFTKDGRHYGVVGNETQVTAADQRDGVQVFEMVFLTADAGSDQIVEVGSTVTLDGSASAVTNGGTLSYSWTQVSGPNVTLNEVSGSPEQATFTMPDTQSELVFDLTVSQGAPTHVVDVDQITVSKATGVTLTPSTVSVVAGATTTYTAVLATQPTADVTVTPTSGTMSRATVSAALTFTSSNWNNAQSITVTGVAAGTSEITHAATSSDTNYEISAAGTVTATVTPQPATLTLTTSEFGNTVAEGGGSVTVTATLDNVGASAVSVTLTASGSATSGSDYTLPSVFTIPAGHTSATGTVQITDDDLDEDNETVVLSASGTGLTVTPVTLTITDNDTAGVTLSTGTVSLAKGAAGTYTAVLDTQPTADVTVTATSGSVGRATVSAARTFTSSNWDTVQTFTVNAVAAGTSVVTHAATSTDTNYGIGSAGTVTVTVTETATPPSTLRLSTNAARVAEDSGSVTVTARLNTAATSPVTVTVTAENESTADSGDYTLPAAFTIPTGQLSVTATITITDDRDDEPDEMVVLSASAASLTVTGVTFTIAENDDHGVTVRRPTARNVFVGRTENYQVRLNTRPTADVTVTASSGNPEYATVTPAALTFTTDNWNTRQTFKLTGVETGTSTVTHAVSGTDPKYPTTMIVDSVEARVSVFVPGPPTPPPPSMLVLTTDADDETVVEGGSVTVTATLDEAATSAVSVTLSATGTATADEDYTLPPVFTIAAGQTTATGTIQITDDETAEDPETVILTTTDTGLTVTPVTLTITDAPGVSLSTSTVSLQEGTTELYTAVLDTQPSADVTVTATSGTPDAATVSEALTFTTDNWGTAQTFTVTGTSTGASEITHTATSNDTNYSIPTIGTVTATITGTDPGTADGVFVDVDNMSSHAASINAVLAAGITTGCSTNPLSYCPDKPVTRAQMATFLTRALKLTDAADAGFVDVDNASSHADSINAVYAAGITTGCGQNPLSYCPDSHVTRAQMATFLTRALKLTEAADAGFVDVDNTSSHADSINAVYAAGITTGCGQNPLSYCPDSHVTRAQMATFLTRALKLSTPTQS